MKRIELWCERHSLAISRWYWRIAWTCLALSFLASAICSITSPFVVLKYFLWGRGELLMGYITGMLMLGALISLFAVWRRPTRYWYVSWFWLVTQIFLMAPQTYYALLTVRKNHWGTR